MRLLYASRTGRRYHEDPYCIGLNSTVTHVSAVGRREIERRRLEPCAHCRPPHVLRVVA